MNIKTDNNIILSVRLMTYNHSDFIIQALEGIAKQQTNFKFEVVIGDDFSTDDNLEKINAFKFKNNNISIHILKRTKGDNYCIKRQKLGRFYNFSNIIENCKGKYIALLDGDDYWTDPLKLQKQVDFLEKNTEYGICFHNVEEQNLVNKRDSKIIPNVKKDKDFSIYDYIAANKTATCSILFKSSLFNPIPTWFTKVPFGDLAIILTVLKTSNQKAHILKEVMGVYRIHPKGIHGSLHKNNSTLIKAYQQHIQFFKIIKKELLFEKKFNKAILTKFEKTNKILASLYKNNNQISKSLVFQFKSVYYKIRKRLL